MKKKVALVVLIIMALVMFGCSSDETNHVENNPDSSSGSSSSWLSGLGALTRVPVLFGVGDGPLTTQTTQVRSKGWMRGSSLYWINTITGSATPIGDIGYEVNGIAYDAITNKLYGITSGAYRTIEFSSQLIEINMATGEGSLIGTITPGKQYSYDFSNPTFNLLGTLYAVNNTDHQLCTINLTTAEANCFGNAEEAYKVLDDDDDLNPLYLPNRGLAFNNIDVLNLIVPGVSAVAEYKDDDDDLSGGARVYTFDTINKKFNYQRTIYGLPYNMAPNGDFDPLAGIYWGLDSLYYYAEVDDDDDLAPATRNLLMIDVYGGNLMKTIPTIENLHAITFGYLDAKTLMLMGLNDLIDFLNPKTID
jgi:hypothetical protein